MIKSGTILIVDDDEVIVELYRSILEEAGWANTLSCYNSTEVMGLLRTNRVSAILLDLYMPDVTGQELLPMIIGEFPEVPVIILTLEDKIDVAVDCMKIGAFDFMTKPIDQNRLVNSIEHAVRVHDLQDEVQVLTRRHVLEDLEDPMVFSPIMTQSESMISIFAYIEAIARSPRALLVTGESGTGKELIARAVHDASRRSGQFVAVNVSGLDDTMFSDTLFGHRKGAFTGADGVRKGLIEQAADGTLFLDEIGDLDNAAQVKLLRLLQEGEYYALGSDKPGRSTARIVAATNAELDSKQQDGTFRRDLYFRLMSHHVRIPPLRERKEDLPVLLSLFIEQSAESLGIEPPSVPSRMVEIASRYEYPGNVRELQSLVHDALSRGSWPEVPVAYFAEYIDRHATRSVETNHGGLALTPGDALPTLREAENTLIAEALRRTGGNQTAAARMLGVSQSTLSRRLAAEQTPKT